MCVRLFVMYCVTLCGLFVCLCWLVFACVCVSCISECVLFVNYGVVLYMCVFVRICVLS